MFEIILGAIMTFLLVFAGWVIMPNALKASNTSGLTWRKIWMVRICAIVCGIGTGVLWQLRCG